MCFPSAPRVAKQALGGMVIQRTIYLLCFQAETVSMDRSDWLTMLVTKFFKMVLVTAAPQSN